MLYSNKLNSIRDEKDLTQFEFGKILDVSHSAISKWENNKSIMPIQKANLIANKYGLSLDYIYKLSKKKYITIINKDLNKVETGKRLAKIRKDNNLTLRELAKILNTTSSTISAYETGKVLLLTSFAIEICKKYNVSLDWIFSKI